MILSILQHFVWLFSCGYGNQADWPFEGTYGVPSGSDVNGLLK